MATREDVLADEVRARAIAGVVFVLHRDDLHHGAAPVLEQRTQTPEVAGQVLVTNRLEHLARDNAVKRSLALGALDVAIVLQTELNQVVHAGGLGARARDGELLFGQRDTDHAAADPLRDAHAHGAPTAADLKHAVRGQQPGASDDLIELAELR